jgi:hypothetical protein
MTTPRKGRPPITWTAPMDSKLREMREQGRGYGTIAAKIGVHHYVVEKRVKELGLPTWGRSGGHRQRGPRKTA